MCASRTAPVCPSHAQLSGHLPQQHSLVSLKIIEVVGWLVAVIVLISGWIGYHSRFSPASHHHLHPGIFVLLQTSLHL